MLKIQFTQGRTLGGCNEKLATIPIGYYSYNTHPATNDCAMDSN